MSFHDELERYARERAARHQALTQAFGAGPAIAMLKKDRPDPWVYMLTRSSRNPGWQLTLFFADGPADHQEFATREQAIEDLAGHSDFEAVKPLTEAEWLSIQNTPRFWEGIKRIQFTGLENTIRHELGYEASRGYIEDAYHAPTIDESIQILQIALRTERRRKPKA